MANKSYSTLGIKKEYFPNTKFKISTLLFTFSVQFNFLLFFSIAEMIKYTFTVILLIIVIIIVIVVVVIIIIIYL